MKTFNLLKITGYVSSAAILKLVEKMERRDSAEEHKNEPKIRKD